MNDGKYGAASATWKVTDDSAITAPGAELLRRTFGVDILTCHGCGSPRRVLAFISNLTTARRILLHLDLPCLPAPLPSAAGPPQLTFSPLEYA